jgi:hypothetical protein
MEPRHSHSPNAQNGLVPEFWGPALWHVLYCIAANYPVEPDDNRKKSILRLVEGLAHNLPCGKCRDNFKKHITTQGDTFLSLDVLHSRDTLFHWVYTLHHQVTKENTHTELPFTLAEARHFIEARRVGAPNVESHARLCLAYLDPMHRPTIVQASTHVSHYGDPGQEARRFHFDDNGSNGSNGSNVDGSSDIE